MKTLYKKLITIFTLTLLTITACTPSTPHVIQNTESNISGNYLGSDYEGNYIWGGAMNLAWTELKEKIIKEDIKLNTNEEKALEMSNKLNNPVFTKKDLDEESYYIKAGYGPKTLDQINKESKEKFPTKSFGDIIATLKDTDIISYAYFLKEVKYKEPFETTEFEWNKEQVKGFYAQTDEQKENIKVIKYENDDKFIIQLLLQDENDELILAKGYDMDTPEEVIKTLNENNKKFTTSLSYVDTFKAPKINLDYHRDYIELIGKSLKNENFKDYIIAQMYENIKFNMDETGAKVENEAVIIMEETSMEFEEEERPIPKNFILNKNYWIIMKRTSSENPYFLLGINNTKLMEKI